MTLIQFRRGTAAQWTAANTELASGEFGFETDTRKFKIGPGNWNALDYAIDSAIAALAITFTDEGGGEGHFNFDDIPISGTLVPPAAVWSGVAGIPFVIVQGTGIDLTGNTASDDAFQDILDDAATRAAAGVGVVEVFIPPGILSLTTLITVGAGVTLRGAGRHATTIRSSNTSSNALIKLSGASDITISDLTLQSTAVGSAVGIHSLYVGLQKRVTITRCRFLDTTNSAVRFPYAVEQLTLTDNIVEGCDSGFVLYSPLLATGLVSTQIVISRNRFRDIGGTVNANCIGSYGKPNDDGENLTSTVVGMEVSGNDLRDFAATTVIPIELTGVTNLVVADNVIDGISTRGVSMGNNYNTTVRGNIIRNQSLYAFELNGGRRYTIVGNIAEKCLTLAAETSDETVARLSDVVIANNIYFGSGASSTISVDAISLRTARRVRITGNAFTDWQYLRSAMRIGNGTVTEDVVVEGNTFTVTDANTKLNTIHVRSAVRTSIVRNTVRIHRNLAAGDDAQPAIAVQMDAATSDTLVEGNHVQFTGTVASATDASGIGNSQGSAAACLGLIIRRNHVIDGPRGLRVTTNSTDLIVQDNDTSTCASADVATFYYLRNTAALNFGALTANSYEDLTITVAGAVTGDCVSLGVPTAAVTAGVAYTAWVSATNTVTVRAHNYTAGTPNPTSGTFKAAIIR